MFNLLQNSNNFPVLKMTVVTSEYDRC